MAFDQAQFQAIQKEFTIDAEQLRKVAEDFREDLRRGAANPDDSSLRMLKSYLDLPTGEETGEYLALDFGGTNVRVLRIRLDGGGRFEIVKKVGRPLIESGKYDYVGAGSTAEQMFGFLAELIDEAVDGDHQTPFLLGHTFSFPSEQTDLYNAKLIIWTKEFATAGVEGKVVNDLLKEALAKRGVTNVTPTAVINDTVAVLLSASYREGDTYIGSIYATGHNTCYLEPFAETGGPAMILNMESGGFSHLTPNRFDREYDAHSEKPGEQRLEKMVSGRYMGELFGMALAELLGEAGKSYGFTAIDMSDIMLDGSSSGEKIAEIVKDKTGKTLDPEACAQIKQLAAVLVERSARLVTATFVGTLWQQAGNRKLKKQHIAVDGSVYEKMPGAKDNIHKALSELLGEDAAAVDTILDNGGSGLGAAIAAAMSQK